MKVNIVLLFTCVNWDNGMILSLSTDEDSWKPPCGNLEDGQEPSGVLRGLFIQSLTIDPNWASFKPMINLLIDGVLHLVYSSQVPMDSAWTGSLFDVSLIDHTNPLYSALIMAIRNST